MKDPTLFRSKRSKAAAKTGKPKTQREILVSSGIPEEEIEKFQDPYHWLEYFPPYGKADLEGFGVAVDWRRSFITTDVNRFYDSFIRWQFETLKAQDRIKFGRRPTIFSPIDGQACADHDRAEGEGVNPQEYTLIKIEVARDEATGQLPAALASLESAPHVYLVAATLRPETMYGQTNCFVLPDGEYGAWEVNEAGDVFLCSERSARNMSFQGLSREFGKTVCKGVFRGEQLLGLPLRAPNATFPIVYCLPLFTISMDKGTGVVTSVPSDAPDDYAALRDLKQKPALREKFGLTAAMVEPFEVVEIIDIPGLGRQAAVAACDEFGVKSQNDKEKLKAAKDKVYLKGFYEGVLLVGTFAGRKVSEAKNLVREEMIREGKAAMYYEPEGRVVSRSGDECVVAFVDQWYLGYGEETWRGMVDRHIHSSHFSAYSPQALTQFENTVGWLREWACSRSFGLGTRLPWDTQFVIESLSDSTIYMAYYTIAHLLQDGVFDGSKENPLGIRPEQLTPAVWDYIFYEDKPFPADCGIAEDALAKLRREFQFWYPVDLRVSGKDLINNHLTMSLYNHAAIWDGRPDRMPQSFFANGHIMVDGAKMSKSAGNFLMLAPSVERYSPDGLRFALADSGDGLEDANFERKTADSAILKLNSEEDFFAELLADIAAGRLRDHDAEFVFADRVFDNRIGRCIKDAEAAFDGMRFREALQIGFYQLQDARDRYRDFCRKLGIPLHRTLAERFMQTQVLLLTPICPHWCEEMWERLGRPGGARSVTRAAWPAMGTIDDGMIQAGSWYDDILHHFRLSLDKDRALAVKKAGGKEDAVPPYTRATIFVATSYTAWQLRALEILRRHYDADTNSFPPTIKRLVAAETGADPELKKLSTVIMNFVGGIVDNDVPARGAAALRSELPFDELAIFRGTFEYVRQALRVDGLEVLPAAEAPAEFEAKAARALPRSPIIIGQ